MRILDAEETGCYFAVLGSEFAIVRSESKIGCSNLGQSKIGCGFLAGFSVLEEIKVPFSKSRAKSVEGGCQNPITDS